MNGPMVAIRRRIASRLVTNLFFGVFIAFMYRLYYYVLLYASKKAPATTFFLSQALHREGIRTLPPSFLPLLLPPQVRQFSFSEELSPDPGG